MKKKLILTISIILLVLVILLVFRFTALNELFSGDAEDGMDDYDKRIEVFNNVYPTDIVIYGEDIPFREALITRKITEITEESLETEKKFQIVVISDLDGTATVTKEELELLLSYLKQGKCDVYFLGVELFDDMVSAGFSDEMLDENDLAAGFFLEDNVIWTSSGIWTVSDRQESNDNRILFSQILVAVWADRLQEEYQ